jgi:hypothetical protein
MAFAAPRTTSPGAAPPRQADQPNSSTSIAMAAMATATQGLARGWSMRRKRARPAARSGLKPPNLCATYVPMSSESSDLPATRISDLARVDARPADYLDGLNPEQREAVEATEGPVLVLAGAGTGKTRVLTTRLAHILATGKARPWELLVVTFTNKAAREMRERITHIIGPSAEGLRWLGHLPLGGAQILRRHAELVGLKSNYTILDTDDQERLIKQVLEAENIDTKRWSPKMLAGLIDQWKNRGWRPRPAAAGRGAGLRQRQGPGAVPAVPGADAHPERLRLRRPAAAQPDHLHHPAGRAGRVP